MDTDTHTKSPTLFCVYNNVYKEASCMTVASQGDNVRGFFTPPQRPEINEHRFKFNTLKG